jgi:hypothetical protein
MRATPKVIGKAKVLQEVLAEVGEEITLQEAIDRVIGSAEAISIRFGIGKAYALDAYVRPERFRGRVG